MASIKFLTDGVEQRYPIDGAGVTLGRGLESDIRLKDIKSSRRHCQILKTARGYEVVDLSSGNGTFINGVQIKQQVLNPGDKIQIGSTTITFQDGDGASRAPAAAGGQRASGGTAVVAKAATAVGAPPVSAQVAAQPTKKITTKTPALKPPTQAVPKPGTQPIARPGTQAVPKAGTQPVSKPGTQSLSKTGTAGIKKTGTGRAPTTRASRVGGATQKFHAEGRRKKMNPVAVLLGCIGGLFLVVVAIILFSGGDDPELIKSQLETYTSEAAKLADDGKYDAAISKYRDALKLIEGNDKFARPAAEIRKQILEVDNTKKDLAAAEASFKTFKDRFEKVTGDQATEFLTELKRFRDQVKAGNFSWLPELNKLIEQTEKVVDTEAAIRKRQDFQARRNAINEKHKIGKDQAHYSNAIRDWEEYLKEKITDDSKQKAEQAMQQVNQMAKAELDRLTKRAERMATDDNNKAGAVELLRRERGRYEKTASYEELENLIKKYEK